MLDAELQEAIDNVGMAFGWNNTRKLWFETRGFTTHLESALKDYPKSDLVDEDELMASIRVLRDFPDPDDDVKYYINEEIDGDSPATAGTSIQDLIDMYGEEAIRELLKKQDQEQLWIDFKNKRDYEHIEAGWKDSKQPNLTQSGDNCLDASNTDEIIELTEYSEEEYTDEDDYSDESHA